MKKQVLLEFPRHLPVGLVGNQSGGCLLGVTASYHFIFILFSSARNFGLYGFLVRGCAVTTSFLKEKKTNPYLKSPKLGGNQDISQYVNE